MAVETFEFFAVIRGKRVKMTAAVHTGDDRTLLPGCKLLASVPRERREAVMGGYNFSVSTERAIGSRFD